MASTLFPPIMDSWMPAYAVGEDIVVSYQVSSYNADEIIQDVQFSFRNIYSNKSLIKPEYKSVREINRQDQTVTLPFNGVGEQSMPIGTYKLQLRFVSPNGLISEASRVCLIKVISKPQITINNFSEQRTNVVTTQTLTLEGILNGEDNLESYRIEVCSLVGEVLFASDTIYAEENYIYYVVPQVFQNKQEYICKVYYTTENGYSSFVSYNFKILVTTEAIVSGEIICEADKEDGSVALNIKIFDENINRKSVIILRTDNSSNFSKWEDLYIFDGASRITKKDYTVKSGMFYKYAIQSYNAVDKTRSGILESAIVKVEFEDTFLTDQNMQFNVKFNDTIGSYKRTVLESKVETIGSQFPFIKRNAKVYYKQFALTGLISWESDLRGDFLNEKNVYDMPELYDEVRQDGEISDSVVRLNPDEPFIYTLKGISVIDHYDITFEREFREKILDYLYNNKVKLFRSPTEGNIIVKLMDISLTPKQEIHRMVYEFTCNVIEIDTNNIANYLTYGILPKQADLHIEHDVKDDLIPIGQIIIENMKTQNEYYNNGDVLLKLMREKYKMKYADNVEISSACFTYLKLTFYGEPSKISVGNGNYISGYLVSINNKNVIVKNKVVYVPLVVEAMKDSGIDLGQLLDMQQYNTGIYTINDGFNTVNSLSFPSVEKDYTVYIEYGAKLQTNFKKVERIDYSNTRTVLGQITDDICASEDDVLVTVLQNKYLVTTNGYKSELHYIDNLHIETQPGVKIRYTKDSITPEEHVIDISGCYDIQSSEYGSISFFSPLGIVLKPTKNRNTVTYEDEYLDLTEQIISALPAIPAFNGLYKLNNSYFLNYYDRWYDVTGAYSANNNLEFDVTFIADVQHTKQKIYIPMQITYKAAIKYNEYI